MWNHRNNESDTYYINWNSASEQRWTNFNNDNRTYRINRNIASVTWCINRSNDSGTYCINLHSAREIRCNNQIRRRKSKRETYFAVININIIIIIIIMTINLQNCLKNYVRKLVGAKRVSWGNPGIEWMMLKCAIRVVWRLNSSGTRF